MDVMRSDYNSTLFRDLILTYHIPRHQQYIVCVVAKCDSYDNWSLWLFLTRLVIKLLYPWLLYLQKVVFSTYSPSQR